MSVRSPERDTDLDSRLVDVDGLRIRTAVRGQGPPVLLIMGIGGNLEMWGRFETSLRAHGLQTITYDAPGPGHSSGYRLPRRVPGLARTTERLLDALDYDRVDVLGVSFGGGVAQQLAHQAPSRIRRLVLAATMPGMGGAPGTLAPCWPWPHRGGTSTPTIASRSPGNCTAERRAGTPRGRSMTRRHVSFGHHRGAGIWPSRSPSPDGRASHGSGAYRTRPWSSAATTIRSSRSPTLESSLASSPTHGST